MEARTLKLLIKDKGIKQTFIADKLGISKTMITQWVKGDRPIPERHISELKRLLA